MLTCKYTIKIGKIHHFPKKKNTTHLFQQGTTHPRNP